jgi:hypothetical protein
MFVKKEEIPSFFKEINLYNEFKEKSLFSSCFFAERKEGVMFDTNTTGSKSAIP